MKLLRPALLAALLVTVVPPAIAQVVEYHGADQGAQDANVAMLTANGYQIVTLTMAGTLADPRYSAVWVQRAGPTCVFRHGLTQSQLQVEVTSRDGIQAPRILTAHGAGANARFAVVFEPVGYAADVWLGVTPGSLSTVVKQALDNGERIRTLDVYGTSADPRIAISFCPNPQRDGCGYIDAIGYGSHQSFFSVMAVAQQRPISVAFTDDESRSVTVWEDTSVGGWIAHHGMTEAQYDALLTQYWGQGNRYPLHVSATGSGGATRYAAIWAAEDLPRSRQFTVTGTAEPDLAAFDGYVQTRMADLGAHAASLAIAKDGKLVYARGFTWAASGYPITQPTSRFRIASCAKPLTSIAIHREFAKPGSTLTPATKMTYVFGGPIVADSRTNDITLDHLLTHSGGWDRDLAFDPMVAWDANVATALNVSLPILKGHIRLYMNGQPLQFSPGARFAYSNYGFSLLGQVLEARHLGTPYAQVMQDEVFDRLGVTRAVIGGSHLDERRNDEVFYHPLILGVARDVNDAQQPSVTSQYGGWNQPNMDSHGGYVMSAPDFAKVLAAFDLGVFNPILGPTQTAAMWNPSSVASDWARGWILTTMPDAGGNDVTMRWHNGILAGTRTLVGRRADGISFVLFTNADVTIGSGTLRALSDLANGVTRWPTGDKFPSVGVPSFHRIDDLMAPLGTPCSPPGGPTPRLAGSGSADIGARLSLDVTGAAPGAPAIVLVGTDPTPLDLTSFGAPGCTLYTAPVLTAATAAGRDGALAFAIDVPVDPGMVGGHLIAQVALLDATANALGLVTTNGLDIRFGGWRGD